MSLKLKALLILAGTLGITIGAASLMQYIALNVSMETIKTIISAAVMGGLLYTMYSLILLLLEHDQKIDEISKNINEITNK